MVSSVGVRTTSDYWWIPPLECISILGMAVNFGITSAASLITIPTLQSLKPTPPVPVPTRDRSKQYATFSSLSERIIPPSNAISLISYAFLAWTCWRCSRVGNPSLPRTVTPTAAAAAVEKLNWLVASAALCASVTAYSLTVMVPLNSRIKTLGTSQESQVEETAFDDFLERWRKLNFVRMSLMAAASICGACTLFKHGSLAALLRIR